MRNIVIGVVIGLIAASIISVIGFNFANTNLLLLGLLAIGIFAFLPLIIKSITSSKVPHPTVYGTSAPKKHTTIDKNQAGNQEKNKESKVPLNKAIIMAGAGGGILIAFFASAIIYLQ